MAGIIFDTFQSDFESRPFLLQEDAYAFAPLASIHRSFRIAGTEL